MRHHFLRFVSLTAGLLTMACSEDHAPASTAQPDAALRDDASTGAPPADDAAPSADARVDEAPIVDAASADAATDAQAPRDAGWWVPQAGDDASCAVYGIADDCPVTAPENDGACTRDGQRCTYPNDDGSGWMTVFACGDHGSSAARPAPPPRPLTWNSFGTPCESVCLGAGPSAVTIPLSDMACAARTPSPCALEPGITAYSAAQKLVEQWFVECGVGSSQGLSLQLDAQGCPTEARVALFEGTPPEVLACLTARVGSARTACDVRCVYLELSFI